MDSYLAHLVTQALTPQVVIWPMPIYPFAPPQADSTADRVADSWEQSEEGIAVMPPSAPQQTHRSRQAAVPTPATSDEPADVGLPVPRSTHSPATHPVNLVDVAPEASSRTLAAPPTTMRFAAPGLRSLAEPVSVQMAVKNEFESRKTSNHGEMTRPAPISEPRYLDPISARGDRLMAAMQLVTQPQQPGLIATPTARLSIPAPRDVDVPDSPRPVGVMPAGHLGAVADVRSSLSREPYLQAVSLRHQTPGSVLPMQPAVERHLDLGRPAAAPAVHVTIGRIEIRAQTPAPAPAPQSRASGAPKPALSLADYLRQRNGGRT